MECRFQAQLITALYVRCQGKMDILNKYNSQKVS